MKSKGVVWHELLWVVRGPQRGKRGPVTIEIENVERRDRVFMQGLAIVATAWFNAMAARRAA